METGEDKKFQSAIISFLSESMLPTGLMMIMSCRNFRGFCRMFINQAAIDYSFVHINIMNHKLFTGLFYYVTSSPKKIKMKMLKHCLLLLTATAGLISARAQTADEIISKHIDAIGGKDKLSQINSVHIESTISAMGNDGPSTINLVNGKGFRLESEINGQKIIQVFTDKGGWAINPFAGGNDAQPIPDDQYKAGRDQIDIGGPLFNYASKGSKVELLGKEDSAYKIKLTNKDSVVTTYYIDPTTYYVKKSVQTMSMMGQDMEVTRTSSDFRKTDFGVVYPFALDISYGGQFNITSTMKKIEFNKPIDPKIFDMPK